MHTAQTLKFFKNRDVKNLKRAAESSVHVTSGRFWQSKFNAFDRPSPQCCATELSFIYDIVAAEIKLCENVNCRIHD